MTDTQDARIHALVNAAIDRELAGHRVAPPWKPAQAPHQSGHPIGKWSVPVLAASVAALLVAVTVLAIGHGRSVHPAPAAHSASPTPTPSRSLDPDQEAAARAYTRAVATAVEATEAAGVSVEPLSAQDAAELKDTTRRRYDITSMVSPMPGQTYPFTISFLVGPSDNPPSVLTTELRDVASGSCARPFLARPGHAYLIHCSMSPLVGGPGRATLTALTPTASLSDGIQFPFSAANFAADVAGVPEASAVAGVSQRPATAAEQRRPVSSVGSLHLPSDPKPGKSYPITLLYVPSSAAPPVAVLGFRFEGVAAGHCPGAFRVRPAHAYQISCQVSFQAGAKAWVYYDVTGPQGMDPTGLGLF